MSTWVLLQGADLEATIMDEKNVGEFVHYWVQACTAAEGKATTMKGEWLDLQQSYLAVRYADDT